MNQDLIFESLVILLGAIVQCAAVFSYLKALKRFRENIRVRKIAFAEQ